MKILPVIILILLCLNTNSQWVKVNNGLGNSQTVLSMVSSGNIIFAGFRTAGIYKSTDSGNTWLQTFSLPDSSVYSLAVNGNNIFAGLAFTGSPHFSGSGVYRSTNSGVNWVLSGLAGKNIISLAVYGDTVFAGTNGYNGVYRSIDNGLSWVQLSLMLINIPSLLINGNIIFAATGQDNGVWKSTNNGNNWLQTSLKNKTIISLASNGGNMFAGDFLDSGVYSSTDSGITWQHTSFNNRCVNSIAVIGYNIFAGTHNTGIYVSNNNGNNWVQRNEGFGVNTSISSFSILNNYLFAGTQDSSIYRRSLNELIGILPISNEVPSSFSLAQNYPNPFNPNTKIKFSIKKSSFAKLTIYDITGRVMAILVNEDLKPGIYEADWDASHRASGVYYYKLESLDYTETRRMVLLK